MKSVQIRIFFGLYFPTFDLNSERYWIRKYGPEKTPYLDNFLARQWGKLVYPCPWLCTLFAFCMFFHDSIKYRENFPLNIPLAQSKIKVISVATQLKPRFRVMLVLRNCIWVSRGEIFVFYIKHERSRITWNCLSLLSWCQNFDIWDLNVI